MLRIVATLGLGVLGAFAVSKPAIVQGMAMPQAARVNVAIPHQKPRPEDVSSIDGMVKGVLRGRLRARGKGSRVGARRHAVRAGNPVRHFQRGPGWQDGGPIAVSSRVCEQERSGDER
jgi:hypothetical protein